MRDRLRFIDINNLLMKFNGIGLHGVLPWHTSLLLVLYLIRKGKAVCSLSQLDGQNQTFVFQTGLGKRVEF